MTSGFDLSKQLKRELDKAVMTWLPDYIVKRKVRPLAQQMWVHLLMRTARLTGAMQAHYEPTIVRSALTLDGPQQGARYRLGVKHDGDTPNQYPPGNLGTGASLAARIHVLGDKLTIGSMQPYVLAVEERLGNKNYRKPRMFKNTRDFLVRNAANIMQD